VPTDDLDLPTAGYVPPPLPASISPDEQPPLPQQLNPLTAEPAMTILPVR
jgi:hypothetical protein